jgi:thiol-disulfide isomerase/thioredoxin
MYAGYHYFLSDAVQDTEDTRTLAPDFVLNGAHGGRVTLSDTAGKVRVLNFWASWSPYSRDELKMLERVRDTYGDQIVVLAIGRDTDTGEGTRYVREQGFAGAPWVLFDPEDTYYASVGGYNMPETVVLNAEGRIVYQIHGPVQEEGLLRAIEMARTEN